VYTNKQVADMLTTINARLSALEVAPTKGSVASPIKTAVAKPRAIATKAEMASGGGFACAKCGRHLRTAKRAAVCGDIAVGHIAR
jgi:hypothetical protein